MDASQTCDSILQVIKNSNINFCLNESPFSVTITLKKSFIRNQDGTVRSSGISRDSCEYVGKNEVSEDQDKKLKTEINKHKEDIDDLKLVIQEHSNLLEKVQKNLSTSLLPPELNNNTLSSQPLPVPITVTASPSFIQTYTKNILPLSSLSPVTSNSTSSPVDQAKNMITISKLNQKQSTYMNLQTTVNKPMAEISLLSLDNRACQEMKK